MPNPFIVNILKERILIIPLDHYAVVVITIFEKCCVLGRYRGFEVKESWPNVVSVIDKNNNNTNSQLYDKRIGKTDTKQKEQLFFLNLREKRRRAVRNFSIGKVPGVYDLLILLYRSGHVRNGNPFYNYIFGVN